MVSHGTNHPPLFVPVLLFLLIATIASAQPPTIQDVQVRQLVYVRHDRPATRSTIGTFEIFFLPTRNPFYANIRATTGPSNPNPAWVVHNLFLADSHWIATQQRLSVRFDLEALGIQPGQPAEAIFFEIVLTPIPRQTAPPFSLTNARTATIQPLHVTFEHDVPFFDGTISYAAGDTSHPFVPLGNLDISPSLPVHHIVGCAIPNLDLDSSSNASDLNGCAPAAGANSLKWLDGLFDDITLPDDLRAVYNALNALTNRKPGKPTPFADFVRAKLDLIEAYDLPITVSFQGIGYAAGATIKSSTGRTKATCANTGAAPTFDWIAGESSDTCDVELYVNNADNSLGHVVTLAGWEKDTGTANGRRKIHYKHDYDQEAPGGTTQTDEAVRDANGVLQIPDFFDLGVDGYIKGAVAECHKAGLHPQFRNGSTTYSGYSKSRKFVLPPRSKITFTFPTDPDRCFNSTLWVQTFPDSTAKEVKHSVWNFNSGMTRTFVNRADSPVVIRLKDDDNRFGRPGPDPGFTVGHKIENLPPGIAGKHDPPAPAAAGDSTSASNVDEYGGFSIGGNDSLHEEFTTIAADSIALDASLGCDLAFAPDRFGAGGVRVYELRHPVPVWNKYWGKLQLRLTIDSVASPGSVTVRSRATGVRDTIHITAPGVYAVPIGGITSAGTFDLILRAADGLAATIDNIGVPSIIEESVTSVPTGIEHADGALACSIEPNPAAHGAKLRIKLESPEYVEVTITAIDGREELRLAPRALEGGMHVLDLPTANLAAGTHICRVRAGQRSAVLQLQVVR